MRIILRDFVDGFARPAAYIGIHQVRFGENGHIGFPGQDFRRLARTLQWTANECADGEDGKRLSKQRHLLDAFFIQ